MVKYLKMAWRNLWRNWRRTSIAVVAIVLGVILLLFFDGFIVGSDQAIFGNAVRLYGGNIQAHVPGYREKASRLPVTPLENPDAVIAAATAQPQVIAAARRINTGGIISSREGGFPVAITGIEPSIEATYSLQAENITQGRFLEDGEGDVVVIGQELARLLDAGVGDRVTLLGRGKNDQMRQRTMTIVGIYSLGVPEAEKGTVFITLPEAQSLYNLRDEVTEVTINLQNVGQEQAVVPVLQAALPNVEIDTFDTLRPEIRETIASKLAFTSFFGLMVIFIASIGILNIQMMAVFERTREMGVLAALGMKGRQIMAVFLVEGTLIGALGALVGGILAVALLLWLGRVGLDMSFTSGFGSITALMGDRLYPSVSPTALVSRLITVVVIAAIASLYPAWQASRKQPAESLHHV
ncbi:MAG: ABC transporter permease [Anaerolineales bacterium]|nr:ABC transporter permease [Anaerolineae bacterium]MCB0255920.1 ABC transporter permease [Anaerolineae bacterium]MCB9143496.1 ABC transporter permease [Anaerolineales bacterium]